jgi:WD40 repeat protein
MSCVEGTMRICTIISAAVVLALAAGSGPLRGGADKEADPARIEALIKQLGDKRFARREAASKELEALGKPAFRALRRAAVSSADPEIRRRAALAAAAIAARVPGLSQRAEVVHRIGWPGVHVYSTTFSPDGRHVLAGGDSNTLRLYEVKTGALVRELTGHGHWIGHALFTPDGKQVLSFSFDRTLRLWDVGTGKELRRFEQHPDGISSMDLTPDGKWAVTGRGDGTLRLWEFPSAKEVRKFEGHPGACTGSFTPDGKQILSSCDRTLHLWDAATGRKLRMFDGHTAPVYGVFVLPGGKQALSYSVDQTARVWDLATGKEVNRINVGPSISDIRGLALSPDGKRILVGGARSNEVRLLELATGREIHRFVLAAPARGLSFSRDGRLAASGSWRGFVYLLRMPGIFDDE